MPSSLESILWPTCTAAKKSRVPCWRLHKVEGRQPCRMLTQFDALPPEEKYVSGHSTKVGGGYGMGRAGPGGRLGGSTEGHQLAPIPAAGRLCQGVQMQAAHAMQLHLRAVAWWRAAAARHPCEGVVARRGCVIRSALPARCWKAARRALQDLRLIKRGNACCMRSGSPAGCGWVSGMRLGLSCRSPPAKETKSLQPEKEMKRAGRKPKAVLEMQVC